MWEVKCQIDVEMKMDGYTRFPNHPIGRCSECYETKNLIVLVSGGPSRTWAWFCTICDFHFQSVQNSSYKVWGRI